jgi:hypothetical protein
MVQVAYEAYGDGDLVSVEKIKDLFAERNEMGRPR